MQSDFLTSMGPMPPNALRSFLRSQAQENRALFDDHFLQRIGEDVPSRPLIIEATAYLNPPLEDSFYFSFLGEHEDLANASFNALVILQRPTAVSFLRRRVQEYKGLSRP